MINIRLFLSAGWLCTSLAIAGAPDAVQMLELSPLRFELAPDGGAATGRGYQFQGRFESSQAILRSGNSITRLRFEGALPTARIEAADKLRSTTSYFFGNDPAQWRERVPDYGRLQVRELYRGVDLAYYGNSNRLEYDLFVKPGADPAQVRLSFPGVPARLNQDGNLDAGFIQKRPNAYQVARNGAHIAVDSRYHRNADGSFGVTLGSYDRGRELVIDPVIFFTAYVYGGGVDIANAVGHDAKGFVYVAGTTSSTDLELVGSSFQTTNNGATDIFLFQIDPHGGIPEVVYSTYLGGTGAEVLGDMVVGPKGVYMTGSTASSGFPTQNGAFTTLNGTTTDAFIVWMDPSRGGSSTLVYSTFLGGSTDEMGNGIAIDSSGRIFVTGVTDSGDFPTAGGGFQTVLAGNQDVFVAAVDPSQSGSATYIYGTYMGGKGRDVGHGIAVAADGTLWVAGGTSSPDFPIEGFDYEPIYKSQSDAFIAQIKMGASKPLYVTYLGGSGVDEATRLLIDPAGRIVVTGYTTSTDFPVSADAMQPTYGGNTDVFVTILNPASTSSDRASQLVYSTYFGGSDAEAPYGLKQDAGGLYIAGYTLSDDLKVSSDALQHSYLQGIDAFVLKFNPERSGAGAIDYLSYVGTEGYQIAFGLDVGSNGLIYLAGGATGPVFDPLHGAGKIEADGNMDAWVMSLNPCSYSVSPGSEKFTAQGGTATITVSAGQDCAWNVTSAASWVKTSATSGVGDGTLTLTASGNQGSSRSGTLNIAGVTVSVSQAGQ